jgi:hypothetical protein
MALQQATLNSTSLCHTSKLAIAIQLAPFPHPYINC